MPVRNQNWYDLQEGRRYPLDDRSTGIDDNGDPIADDVIVDCHIRFPNTIGEFAYVNAINVSANIVTLIISVADAVDDPATFAPIASVSVTKPMEIGVNYPIVPLAEGVAGWVAFGSGVGEIFSGRYSTPIQTFISPRCARPYRPLPIPTLAKLNLATTLTGMVNILAKTPVVATYYDETLLPEEERLEKYNPETNETNTDPIKAIVFRLAGDLAAFNPLKEYGGDCKGRPESGTCGKPGLQNINGVKPDCAGNIQITTAGFSILPFENCGGFDIVTDNGLSVACNNNEPPGKKRPNDLCVPSVSTSDGLIYWPDPLDQIPVPPDVVSSISLGSEDLGGCYAQNTCFDFATGQSSAFVTKTGLFVFEQVPAPPTCNSTSAASVTSSAPFVDNANAPRYTYAAANISGLNVAILRNCYGDINAGTTVSSILRLTPGPRRNGGIILNYNPANPITRESQKFIAAAIDVDAGGLQILRYNGSNIVVEARTPLNIRLADWYKITATTQTYNNAVLVSVTAVNLIDETIVATISTTVQQYGNITGAIGLFANRAYTYFSNFTIGE